MSLAKQMKDYLAKLILGRESVPTGLFEMSKYFAINGPIRFEDTRQDGIIIAKSTNFRHGSIITSGKDEDELDQNIKDAILTSFEIPSAYSKQAGIHKIGDQKEYAIAQ